MEKCHYAEYVARLQKTIRDKKQISSLTLVRKQCPSRKNFKLFR